MGLTQNSLCGGPPGARRSVWTLGRTAFLALFAAVSLLAGLAATATATNPYSQGGNNTEGCSVAWHAQSDVSLERNGEPGGYPNAGYIYEINPNPPAEMQAVKGPGHFLLHHWFQAGNDRLINFRVPLATDYAMHDVTMVISAGTANWSLNTAAGADSLTPLVTPTRTNLQWYHLIDGDAKYTTQMPYPTVTVQGGNIVLHWDYLPNNSAGIYSFQGTANVSTNTQVAGVYPSFIVDANLNAQYFDGYGCAGTLPDLPAAPEAAVCQAVFTGRTQFPINAPDVTVREKWELVDGVMVPATAGEVNADGWGPAWGAIGADGWGPANNRTLRIYGATDKELNNVTFTATAAQGFTFGGNASAIVTGEPRGMGQLYGNGFTVAIPNPGTPVVSSDGKTISITFANMPAKSGFAFTVTPQPDGSNLQMVIHEAMKGDIVGCTPPVTLTPPVAPTGTPVATPQGTPTSVTPAPTPVVEQAVTRTTLKLTKVGPRSVRAGTTVTYTVRVRNTGKVVARNVVVRDAAPASMTLAKTSVRGDVERGRVIVLKVGNLAPGATRTVRVTFLVQRQAKGQRTNVAVATASNAARVVGRATTRIVTVKSAAVKPITPRVTG